MSMKGGEIKTKRFTEKDHGEEGIYEGEFNDKGERHGKGIMTTLTASGKVYTVYEGEWKNDKPDGNGKLIYGKKSRHRGATYEGEFKNDDFHGHGLYIDPNEQITYRGQFANNKKNGWGYITTTNAMGSGMVYGMFENDLFVKGSGTRFSKYSNSGDDSKQEGEFENDKLVKGKKSYMNGLIEEGDFENGEIIYGKTTFPCGSVYVGTYDDQGDLDGVGTLVGKFKYHGEYQHGKMSGFGVITYPDGSVYEGQFKNDRKDGMGKLTLPNGTTKTGRFHHNQPSPDVVVLSAAQNAAQNSIVVKNAAKNSMLTELGLPGSVFPKRGSRRK